MSVTAFETSPVVSRPRFAPLLARIAETLAVFSAANSVAAALESRRQPAAADLKVLGIERSVRLPYRV